MVRRAAGRLVLWISLISACAPRGAALAPNAPDVVFGTTSSAPALRGEGMTAQLGAAAKKACAASRADLDGRLGGVALAIAEHARGNLRAPSLRAVNARAQAQGVVEPTPEVLLAAAGSQDELERALVAQASPDAATSASERTHCGAAVVNEGGKWIAALVWSKRILSLDDVPAQVSTSSSVVLRGRLLAGYRKPVLAITDPDGQVRRIPLGAGPAFERRLKFAQRGEHRVEILAEGASGVTVAANFPIAVGTSVRRESDPALGEDPVAENSPEEVQRALIAKIAKERRQHGLSALKTSPEVEAVARAHSQDMREHHFIAHTSPTTGDPPERVARAGLTSTVVLENIGRGYSADEIHMGLMESPGHRGNILSPVARELGVAVVAEPEGERLAFIATEVFTRLVQLVPTDQARAALMQAVQTGRRKARLKEVKLDGDLSQVAEEAARTLADAPAPRHQEILAAATRKVRTPPRGMTKLGAALIISPDVEQIAQHSSLHAPALGFLGLGVVQHKTAHGQSYVVVLLLGER